MSFHHTRWKCGIGSSGVCSLRRIVSGMVTVQCGSAAARFSIENGNRSEMKSFPFLRRTEAGTLVDVYIQPRAARNQWAGVHQGSLKIRLTAPPVEGEANKECVKFLARAFQVSKSSVEIVQGHKSRRKTILVRDVDPEVLAKRLGDVETVV